MNYKDYCDFAEYLKKITPNASVVKANADKAMTLLICGIQFRPEGVGVSLGSDKAAAEHSEIFFGRMLLTHGSRTQWRFLQRARISGPYPVC